MIENSFSLEINEKYTRICSAKLNNNNKIELLSLGHKETTPLYFTAENETVVEKQAEIIASLHNELKIKSKNVHVIIPDGYTYSQIVEMPKLKEKELLAAIHYQADEFIPMPIEETSLDLEILSENNKTKKSLILIIASPKKLVEQVEKTISAAHLNAETLENELSAIGRLSSELVQPKGATLIVNFGSVYTSVYGLDPQTNLIAIIRTFDIGFQLFVKDIMVNLNWDEKKASEALKTIGFGKSDSNRIAEITDSLLKQLFDEIDKIIILARDRYNLKVDKIYGLNYFNNVAFLKDKFHERFAIPCQSFPIEPFLVQNPLVNIFSKDLSSFISVIAGNLR